MGHGRRFSAIILWISVANIGLLAYVYSTDLNHEPLPETAAVTEGKALLCEGEGVYTKMDPSFCDRYVSCTYGQSNYLECPDGYGFQPLQGCKLLHLVDCGLRTQLQTPKGTRDCPRLNGIYPDLRGCGHYIRCTNGNSVAETCNGQSIFDDKRKSCRDPSLEEYTACFLQDQKPTNYNSFGNQPVPTIYSPSNQLAQTTYKPNPTEPIHQQIPTSYNVFANQQVPTTYNPPANLQVPITHNPSTVNQQKPSTTSPAYNQLVPPTYPPSTSYQVSQYAQTTPYEPYQSGATAASSSFFCPPTNFFEFGDHTRYQYPGNCHLFYICLRDGSVKLGGCQVPKAYDPKSKVCIAMQAVPSCP